MCYVPLGVAQGRICNVVISRERGMLVLQPLSKLLNAGGWFHRVSSKWISFRFMPPESCMGVALGYWPIFASLTWPTVHLDWRAVEWSEMSLKLTKNRETYGEKNRTITENEGNTTNTTILQQEVGWMVSNESASRSPQPSPIPRPTTEIIARLRHNFPDVRRP